MARRKKAAKATKRASKKKARSAKAHAKPARKSKPAKHARPAKAPTRHATAAAKAPHKKLVGEVTHYFTNIEVAVIKLSDALKQADKISVEGATTNFEQKVDSMQVEHKTVKEARKGQSVGLKVRDRTREGDKVYRVA